MTGQRSQRIVTATYLARLWAARWLPATALGAALVTVLAAGGYLGLRALADRLIGGPAATAAVLALGLTALLFLPLHLHIERLVDRLRYGSRPAPYSVLADITALSRSSSKDAPNLAGVAEAVARGLGASWCRLTVIRPGLRERSYVWPDGDTGAGERLEVPIRLGADQIGSIAVNRAAVAGGHSERRHLLADIAESLGVVLQVSRLGIELERQLRVALAHAEDIAISRRQAVAEMDSERRTMERNLHDGAQHHLVSLQLALGLVEHQVAGGQFDQARDRLGQLATQIDNAEAVLVETATGVSSLVLSERGLLAALDADLSGLHPPIAVSVAEELAARRFPPEVEAAVYFSCLEAVSNARKHAPATVPEVALWQGNGALRFLVRDRGPGFVVEPDAGGSGSGAGGGRGLRNMTARITAVGGTISIQSSPGAGTTIEGCVPLPAGTPSTAPDGDVRSRQPVADQVRHLLREACELYRGSAQSRRLGQLHARLDEPVRIGIVGLGTWRRWHGTPETVAVGIALQRSGLAAVDADLAAAEPALLALDEDDAPPVDGLVVLIGHPDDVRHLATVQGDRAQGDRVQSPQVPTVGVLVAADQVGDAGANALPDWHRAAAEYGRDPQVRQVCREVVGLAGSLAVTGATLREAEYLSLRRLSEQPEPQFRRWTSAADRFLAPGVSSDPAETSRQALLDRFGLLGIRVAVAEIRAGRAPDPDALSTVLQQRSGLLRLQELLTSQFTRRCGELQARSVLRALDAVARCSPPGGGAATRLRYQLERVRSGAPELTEIDLVDQLRSGALLRTDQERRTAETLLGASGTEPPIRLGLPADAHADEVRRAATRQLAQWQRTAAHPASTKATRDAAEVLIRTCEELLTQAGPE